jgi:hypothetical protein
MKTAAEADGRPHRLEQVGRKLLRHEADQLAGGAVVAGVVVAGDRHGAGGRNHQPADDVDQRRLAGAVGAEERQDFALADVEVDALERLKT